MLLLGNFGQQLDINDTQATLEQLVAQAGRTRNLIATLPANSFISAENAELAVSRMDFFEAQARAKKRTNRLVFLFALAVLGTIAAGYVSAILWLNQRGSFNSRHSRSYSYNSDDNSVARDRGGIHNFYSGSQVARPRWSDSLRCLSGRRCGAAVLLLPKWSAAVRST